MQPILARPFQKHFHFLGSAALRLVARLYVLTCMLFSLPEWRRLRPAILAAVLPPLAVATSEITITDEPARISPSSPVLSIKTRFRLLAASAAVHTHLLLSSLPEWRRPRPAILATALPRPARTWPQNPSSHRGGLASLACLHRTDTPNNCRRYIPCSFGMRWKIFTAATSCVFWVITPRPMGPVSIAIMRGRRAAN